tara:strand:+ start:2598 stop:3572 length:975 start_codon:yes stop_codon:yes gene_type:complete
MVKVNKKTAKVGDATIESTGVLITFPKDFKAWETKCSGTGAGGKQNMLEAVEQHATNPRSKSPNTGNDGAHLYLAAIRKLLEEKEDTVYFEEDAEKLETILNDIEGLKDTETLNPQNIKFSVPKKFNSKNGNYAQGVKKDSVYGHYLSTFNHVKNKTPDKQTDGSGWVSDKPNTATPPIYQALYGGKLITTGLVDVLKKAIDDIDEQRHSIEITTSKPARALVSIPDFRKRLASAMSSASTQEGVSVSKVMRRLSNKEFKVPASGKSQRFLANYIKSKELAGTITSFKIKLTPAKTKKLIGYYMQSNMSVKTKPIIKSWKEVLL